LQSIYIRRGPAFWSNRGLSRTYPLAGRAAALLMGLFISKPHPTRLAKSWWLDNIVESAGHSVFWYSPVYAGACKVNALNIPKWIWMLTVAGKLCNSCIREGYNGGWEQFELHLFRSTKTSFPHPHCLDSTVIKPSMPLASLAATGR